MNRSIYYTHGLEDTTQENVNSLSTISRLNAIPIKIQTCICVCICLYAN